MIVFLMLGVLAALTFLCVSPLISHLASRTSSPAKPSRPRPMQKNTHPARRLNPGEGLKDSLG